MSCCDSYCNWLIKQIITFGSNSFFEVVGSLIKATNLSCKFTLIISYEAIASCLCIYPSNLVICPFVIQFGSLASRCNIESSIVSNKCSFICDFYRCGSFRIRIISCVCIICFCCGISCSTCYSLVKFEGSSTQLLTRSILSNLVDINVQIDNIGLFLRCLVSNG